MGFNKSEYRGNEMSSAAITSRFVRRMAEIETRGFGDDEGALRRLEAKFGIGYWTLKHLKLGYAKTVTADVAERIRHAYLSYCEQQIGALQHEIELERAAAPDHDLEDLERQASALAEKIAEAKRARLIRRGRG